MRLPSGAHDLARARMAGKRPVGPIILTDAHDIARCATRLGFYPLRVDFSHDYDLRVLHALDVWIVTRTDRSHIGGLCQTLMEAKPRTFSLHLVGALVEHERVIA